MRRSSIAFVAFAAFVSLGVAPTLAQSNPPKPRSPGEIAAASKLLAETNENCRRQANDQHLHLLKRRRFMRECRNKTL
jgi:hypothetical protein